MFDDLYAKRWYTPAFCFLYTIATLIPGNNPLHFKLEADGS
jgi:hypothetical protein